jgi:hypothetical protein
MNPKFNEIEEHFLNEEELDYSFEDYPDEEEYDFPSQEEMSYARLKLYSINFDDLTA